MCHCTYIHGVLLKHAFYSAAPNQEVGRQVADIVVKETGSSSIGNMGMMLRGSTTLRHQLVYAPIHPSMLPLMQCSMATYHDPCLPIAWHRSAESCYTSSSSSSSATIYLSIYVVWSGRHSQSSSLHGFEYTERLQCGLQLGLVARHLLAVGDPHGVGYLALIIRGTHLSSIGIDQR